MFALGLQTNFAAASPTKIFMLKRWQTKWDVSTRRLVIILCVFAVTGTATAYVSKAVTGWAGFDENTFWFWKFLLRLIVLLFGYQIILLAVAFLFGEFPFFWQFEKKILQSMRLTRKDDGRQTTDDGIKAACDQRPTVNDQRKRIAVFASGTGSNAQKIIEHFNCSPLPGGLGGAVALIVCNKPGAGVLNVAEKYSVPTLLIEKERFFRGDGYLPELKKHGIDFIVLAGFLWKIPQVLIDAYRRRIINIHPALLPKYGGKGMYGSRVHEAVLAAGEKESGITIHYVDEHYDNGDIIFQARCEVKPDDTPETLAQRIHHLEHEHYPKVIEKWITSAGLQNR